MIIPRAGGKVIYIIFLAEVNVNDSIYSLPLPTDRGLLKIRP